MLIFMLSRYTLNADNLYFCVNFLHKSDHDIGMKYELQEQLQYKSFIKMFFKIVKIDVSV